MALCAGTREAEGIRGTGGNNGRHAGGDAGEGVMHASKYEWRDDAPAENGDFFYYGPLPDGGRQIVAIVQIATNPDTGVRMASLLIPPGWRGDESKRAPVVHFGALDQWK